MSQIYSFVFTLASVSWMLLSFLSFILMSLTFKNARWIIGKIEYNVTGSDVPVHQSFGIDTRCSVDKNVLNCVSFAIEGLSTDPLIFPTLWKISYIFFLIGLYVTFSTSLAAFASCYFRTAYNKSIFNIVGCVQALAGLFFVNGFVFYMGGWGNKKVQALCGENSGPFTLGDCTLGSTFYYALLGVVITFLSAGVSSIADRSVFRYKVTRRINAGKKLICVI